MTNKPCVKTCLHLILCHRAQFYASYLFSTLLLHCTEDELQLLVLTTSLLLLTGSVLRNKSSLRVLWVVVLHSLSL